MSKTLWNMGRCVGLSAYEIYLKYIASEAPNATPATEKEWLSSMLTMGNSMLLRIGTDNISGVHHRDIPLPAESKICAANTILASFFIGAGAIASNDDTATQWATRVTDYGPLIENNSESYPTTGGSVPPTDISVGDLSDTTKAQIPEYLKIIDAIVIQPGTWVTSDQQPPEKDFKPTLAQVPTLRISFRDSVDVPFFILLTGFSNKFVVQGVSSVDTATSSLDPADGDFLGPWTFPWAAKVVFSIPPAFLEFYNPHVVDVHTEDIAAMQIYNTKYIWIYRMAANSGAPSQTDLGDTRSLYQLMGVTGYVSDKFLENYCVDYDTAIAACAVDRLCDGMQMQKSFIDQITDIYGAVYAQANFKFFLWSNVLEYHGPNQQGIFCPVNVNTKSFAFTLTTDNIQMQVDHGINFSTTGTTSIDIMGGLYNRTGADAGKEYDSDGNLIENANGVVFEDHPALHTAVKEYATFTRPNVCVPKAPASYEDQFVNWFSATPVTDILDSTTISNMGLHADYIALDFQSFLQYAAAQRDLTAPIDAEITDVPINKVYYIYPADVITNSSQTGVADANFTWDDGNTIITPTAMAKASMSKIDYYKPVDLNIIDITVTVDHPDTSTYTTTVVENGDITDVCTNSAYHKWASVATTKENQTKALSLIDNFGALLSTAGSSGLIPADVLRWADILDALNQNKAIDLLGGLINMKNSGTNYVQLDTLRIYLSTTEPTGTIPEGSIGIGWGSSIYTYTSGAWSAIS